jgi:hypothetical protein
MGEPQEIPLRGRYRQQGFGQSHKSKSNDSRAKRLRATLRPGEREAAMEVTRANQMALVLVDGRKRRWMRYSDWLAMDHEGNKG